MKSSSSLNFIIKLRRNHHITTFATSAYSRNNSYTTPSSSNSIVLGQNSWLHFRSNTSRAQTLRKSNVAFELIFLARKAQPLEYLVPSCNFWTCSSDRSLALFELLQGHDSDFLSCSSKVAIQFLELLYFFIGSLKLLRILNRFEF